MTDRLGVIPIRILLLEDSAFDADLIMEHLMRLLPPPQVERVVDRESYLSAMGQDRFDVILSDYSLPGFDGMAALELARAEQPNVPFIFVSGVLGEESAIASFNRGATDYVLKQRLVRLPAAVERAVAEAREKADRRKAEQQTQLLVAELSHRVKNTLATVISIARRTARGARSVEEYEKALLSRLRALSDAHALVFESNWRNTDLRELLERTMEPFRRQNERQIRIEGPHVSLDPRSALSLSLVFHELATNAAKYGALSSHGGWVSATWADETALPDGAIVMKWEERGGPPVSPPERVGFGSSLIERSLSHELEGAAHFRYEPQGLTCELRFIPDIKEG